ncbi:MULTISPECIES: hypothetical protein [Pelosinus]|jgi:hypothetical protein|uniref:Uncharacterized protein n=2 Tax=Pelosinus TaxID=365348 RepID=I8U1W8_9FIRM|nr:MULTISPECIES: hypothetical protein [Pelosinus]AJQ27031.1 hypothetical protein JBW_01681 [Pelosinus fermentans JBW45]MCC5466780.1 hypothetical protein [Pelosinus baikalensis]
MFRHHWHHNRKSHMMEDMMGSKLGMALTAGALVYLGSKLIRRLKYH